MKNLNASSSLKVRGYLKMCRVTQVEIAKLAGVKSKTVSVVLGGHGTSPRIRKAAIELVRLTNPSIARLIEKLWPEGERLAA